MKYRSRLRVSRVVTRVANRLKSSIIACTKRDVPTYIAIDVSKRLREGEREIVLPMCKGEWDNRGVVDYLNEYHDKKHCWELEFLQVAFTLTEERIRGKLSKYSDVNIETFNISDTDKRIVIKLT